MNCPHHILVNKKHLYICIHTTWDYNHKRWVPKKMWFNPFRYEIKVFGLWINQGAKYMIPVANFIFKLTKRIRR